MKIKRKTGAAGERDSQLDQPPRPRRDTLGKRRELQGQWTPWRWNIGSP